MNKPQNFHATIYSPDRELPVHVGTKKGNLDIDINVRKGDKISDQYVGINCFIDNDKFVIIVRDQNGNNIEVYNG